MQKKFVQPIYFNAAYKGTRHFTVFSYPHFNINEGSLFHPPPPSHKHHFHGVTSGFTRLNMKTKYVCHGLISPDCQFF